MLGGGRSSQFFKGVADTLTCSAIAVRIVGKGHALVGADASMIAAETSRLLDDPAAYQAIAWAHNPYGDGLASQRIAEILALSVS